MDITPCSPTFLLDCSSTTPAAQHEPTQTDGITPCEPTFITHPKPKKRKASNAQEPCKTQRSSTHVRHWNFPTMQVPTPKRVSTQANPPHVVKASEDTQWWIQKSLHLPEDRRNGWVIAWVIETHFNEHTFVEACEKVSFIDRMQQAGLGDLVNVRTTPRKKCAIIACLLYTSPSPRD